MIQKNFHAVGCSFRSPSGPAIPILEAMADDGLWKTGSRAAFNSYGEVCETCGLAETMARSDSNPGHQGLLLAELAWLDLAAGDRESAVDAVGRLREAIRRDLK